MNLLILGGTRFVGRHLVIAALARDHRVTLFNRGNHSPPVLTVETIIGDRNTDLTKLKDRQWDAVIDTCGHLPEQVRAAALALSGSVDRYIFISSQSAYADVSKPGVDESAPLATITNEQLEEANQIASNGGSSANFGKLYGPLKASCERTAEEVLPGRVLIIRPGLIVGPDDYTDRFTYWVARVAKGGEVLAPGRPDRFVQFIDVRDLAESIVRMVESSATGVYNMTGPASTWTMSNLLEECKRVSGSDALFTWVDEAFLLKEEVAAWSEMPLWLPEAAPHLKGFMFLNSDKAIQAGLRYRPLQETIAATLNWYRTSRTEAGGSNQRLLAGIDAEREQAVLQRWRQHP